MRTDSTIVDLSNALETAGLESLFTDGASSPTTLLAEHYKNQSTRVVLGVACNDELSGAVIARTPHAGVCEVLAYGATDPDDLARLTDTAADQLHSVSIWASIDQSKREWWEQIGFSLRPDPDAPGRWRAERRHPPEPNGFFTSPQIRATAEREISVKLPPPGNTLPIVPVPLREHDLPAFVARWILDADEVGYLMQEFAPDLYPPVTPAVRPASMRKTLGSLAHVLGDPSFDEQPPTNAVPGLPAGLRVPVALIERLAAAERITGWLREAKRVHEWAASLGHALDEWVLNDPWEPHAEMEPELDRRYRPGSPS